MVGDLKKGEAENWECTHLKCREMLRPSNAATNFRNPALAVQLAVEKELLKPGRKVLEIGAGNLRNARFLVEVHPESHIYAFELDSTRARFQREYRKFLKLGGRIVGPDYVKRKYDAIVCTFVLETICPAEKRDRLLRSICGSLKGKGVLLGSFRGYPGVRGSRYKKCPAGEGFITPMRTFVKPYSLPEIQQCLSRGGFAYCCPLQKYRVERPENIHLAAFKEVSHGQKVVGELLQ